ARPPAGVPDPGDQADPDGPRSPNGRPRRLVRWRSARAPDPRPSGAWLRDSVAPLGCPPVPFRLEQWHDETLLTLDVGSDQSLEASQVGHKPRDVTRRDRMSVGAMR